MPVNARCTFFFEYDKWGWTETFFRVSNSLQEAYDNAVDTITHRMKLNGGGVIMSYLRVSDDDVRRDALLL